MAATKQRLPREVGQEIADIERGLRLTEGVYEPTAQLDAASGRLYWDTWEPNEALRSEVLANVCTEVATSDHWDLVSVHDAMERDNGRISNAVTIKRDRGDC